MDKNLNNICGIIEAGSILTLAGMGLYWIVRCSKAEKKLTDEKLKNALLDFDNCLKGIIINHLDKKLEA